MRASLAPLCGRTAADQADVTLRAQSGVRPLHLAAEEGHVDCVRALIDGKAELDAARYAPPSIRAVLITARGQRA